MLKFKRYSFLNKNIYFYLAFFLTLRFTMSHLLQKKTRSSDAKIYRQVSLQPDYRKNQFFFFKERSQDIVHRLHEVFLIDSIEI